MQSRRPFGYGVLAATLLLPILAQGQSSLDRDFGGRLPSEVGVPLPLVKPAQPESFERARVTESARASRLFDGEVGDRSLGEGVIIFGPSDSGALTLEILQTLGADSARGLDTLANDLGTSSGVRVESEQSAFLRDRTRAAAALVAKQPPILFNFVRLRALDKVTARISTLTIPAGGSARFGSLSIYNQGCQKTPPSEPPETAAFLQIQETAPSGTVQSAFSGWMFASNPAISGLEHAVYDVWVADCTNEPS